MSEDNENPRPRSRRKQKRGRSPLPWFFLFLLMTIAILLYFLYFEKSGSERAKDLGLQSPEATSLKQFVAPEPQPQQDPEVSQSTDNPIDAPATDTTLDQANTSADNNIEESDKRSDPVQPEPETLGENNGQTCQPALRTIKEFYSHLDTQEYLKPYQLDKASELYFSSLLQKVVDNPPIVTGETDDLFNILQNTAHFFRIVGKKNIFTLKAILDREKDSFETVLADFYKLTDSPDCLAEGFGLKIPESALYDYAGFFLNTMGGRLYLFRRDSVSRLAVSYYSILIVDKANSNGTNKHGIDIAPAIHSLIEELENSGSRLRMRDKYLDKLYGLEEKYL
jgi:hypothetical protein